MKSVKELVPPRRFFGRAENIGALLRQPFQTFVEIEAAGGILLIFMAVTALIWANSRFLSVYEWILHLPLSAGVGSVTFKGDVHFVINEGLMTLFFFVVGLEIKREVLVGELSSFRQAILPAAGAAGGVVVPASIYYLFTYGTPSASGWGIPMATDIAFVLGALTLLGARVPSSLAVFLVSLAIFDDLSAVIVIALFYTKTLYLQYLALAGLLWIVLMGVNLLGFRHPLPYVLLGLVFWALVYISGIHATIAGVALALTIPSRSALDTCVFHENIGNVVQRFVPQDRRGYVINLTEKNQVVVRALELICRRVEPTLQRLESSLHPWVVFLVVPLFALANSGVPMPFGSLVATLTGAESAGIIAGLFLGKPIGVFSATWIAVASGLTSLPPGVTFRHVFGGALLCGIGFTMSLFIADLSFSDPVLLSQAKMGILVGSLVSGSTGGLFLYLTGRPRLREGSS